MSLKEQDSITYINTQIDTVLCMKNKNEKILSNFFLYMLSLLLFAFFFKFH